MARGAWSKTAWIVIEIVNAMPKFAKVDPLSLGDVDPFNLYDQVKTDDRMSYDPRVLQMLGDRLGD